MNKLIMLHCILVFLSCTNRSSVPATEQNDTARTTAAVGTSLSKESELQILDGCIANAKDNAGNDLDNARAYALCRCVLLQMQEKYPGADSTELVAHLSDTAAVMEMAKQCQ